MELEKIGFYTLSDARILQVSPTSPMWRCELVLTDRCNFKCPYCRGLRPELRGDMPFQEVLSTIFHWNATGLKNIRFSGGEPTLYPYLGAAVSYCRKLGVERIALSTNGSAPLSRYKHLVEYGVNDMSISLDACCSSFGEKMCGGIGGAWEKVTENIREISKICYVSLGMVFTEDTIGELVKTVEFGHSLGVADIRVISAAQYNETLKALRRIPKNILDAHPILNYRVTNGDQGRNVRGLTPADSHRCRIVMDDGAVAMGRHFPCIIYMREGGDAIGKVGRNMRRERIEWMMKHDPHKDPICSKNCLDVCIDYNNRYRELRGEE